MVRAERDPAAVLRALAEGAFYSSSGAELHDLRVTDSAVEVDCSPAVSVTLRSGPWNGGRVNADPRRMNWRGEILARDSHGLITSARLRLPERFGWARVEVAGAGWRPRLDEPPAAAARSARCRGGRLAAA